MISRNRKTILVLRVGEDHTSLDFLGHLDIDDNSAWFSGERARTYNATGDYETITSLISKSVQLRAGTFCSQVIRPSQWQSVRPCRIVSY